MKKKIIALLLMFININTIISFADTKSDYEEINNNIVNIQDKLISVGSQISDINTNMEELNLEIDNLNKQRETLNKENDNMQELYGDRLREKYKENTFFDFVDSIINSDGISDFFAKVGAFKIVSDADNKIINEIESNIEELNKNEDALQDKLQEYKKNQDEVVKLKEDLDKELNELIKQKEKINPANQVVLDSYNYLNIPYEWGATGPTSFDCSGFTSFLYGKLGYSIGRTTYDQIYAGKEVSLTELKAGDLIFFGDKEAPHHVAIYIGDNKYIHAPQTGDVIKISEGATYKACAARRIVND